jgi:hypothetical protein
MATGRVSMEEWVRRFRAVGLDDAAMKRWHGLFESEDPEGHRGFLQWLGVSDAEASLIRGRRG